MTATAVVLDDPGDPRLDPYRSLNDRVERQDVEAGLVVAEGMVVVQRLAASAHRLASVLTTPAHVARVAGDAAVAATGAPVLVVEPSVRDEVVGFRVHQRALAVGERAPDAPLGDVVGPARSLLVLEGLNDHSNLGVLFRTAHALGVDGVVLDGTCADPLYRRCVRTSMGWALHQPWARVRHLDGWLARLEAAGFVTVATTPDPDAPTVDEVAARRPDRVAVVVGAEGPGLQRRTLRAATTTARIPMASGVDSLNVSVAAGIALHALAPRA